MTNFRYFQHLSFEMLVPLVSRYDLAIANQLYPILVVSQLGYFHLGRSDRAGGGAVSHCRAHLVIMAETRKSMMEVGKVGWTSIGMAEMSQWWQQGFRLAEEDWAGRCVRMFVRGVWIRVGPRKYVYRRDGPVRRDTSVTN